MFESVLDGEGLNGVAELAAAEVSGPVAIVLPARDLAARAPGGEELNGLADYARARVAGEEPAPPERIALEEPIMAGGAQIGVVLLLNEDSKGGEGPSLLDRADVLHAAALAVLAEVAVADAREEAEARIRGSLIEDLRGGSVSDAKVIQRASKLGCDLGRGAVALAAELSSSRPSHAVALIEGSYDGAVAQLIEGWLYAVLPARGGDDAPERTLGEATKLANRLRRHGVAAASSFYAAPGDLHRALREAELVVEAIARDERIAEALDEGIAASGVYRLLFRALITDPEEVRSFYEDTVEPLVRYDRQYRSELLSTLEEYLAGDCNMNATARSIHAHRHTVAYRLDRIRELSGLDPAVSEDRERLGLGAKAYRILAPTLPR